MNNSEKKIRLGIVGCGAITREGHLPEILQYPNIDIRYLCDTNKNFAEIAKLEFGLDAVITDDISVFRDQVDCAVVAVPPRLHAPISTQLMQMGIDVMVEKPTASDATHAQQMADVAASENRIVTVGLTTRFHHNNHALRELVSNGAVGDVVEVSGEMGAPLDWTMTTDAYYNKRTTAGGVFYDVGVHMLDRVIWLFGDLQNISYQDDSYGGVESNGILTADLQLPTGTVPFKGNFSWTHMLDNCIRVVGTEAIAEARLSDPDHVYLIKRVGSETLEMQIKPQGAADSEALTPMGAQWDDFLNSMKTRTPPIASVDTTIRALQVIEEAYSLRTPIPQPWVETGRSAI